ncbi:transposase [Cecembia lonarensis]|uniref:Transposase n=1 Tax=Cecembia lonarensis (strain CCUG 58316 / KCTC 22772 / LW9) TaxID=1225176 RepID=K1LEY3_CECL9|nr:transposase [Cecembia lonarensis]EKB48938.1 Transposase [Cecembia lonarensis LW9]
MKHSHSEIWTHLVLSTKNQEKIFGKAESKAIMEAMEDFIGSHEDQSITYSVLPEHIHILIKLPENISLNGFASHLQTFIKTKLSLNKGLNHNFQWEKNFHAHSVSINRLSAEKSMILRQEVKHREITFEEEMKFLGL